MLSGEVEQLQEQVADLTAQVASLESEAVKMSKVAAAGEPSILSALPEPRVEEQVLKERVFIDNLLARINSTIVIIWCTGLAPWEFEFSFSSSLTST